MKDVRFFVAGKAVPKARPRVANGHAYTPATTKNYQERVAWAYKVAGGRNMGDDCALFVEIQIVTSGNGPDHKIRADVDNIAKSILDALNGVAWKDDQQVTDLHIRKRRAAKGEAVGASVYVAQIGDVSRC